MKLKHTVLISAALLTLMLCAPSSLLAHHSRAMFDMAKNVTYVGVVDEYRWENPHSHIVITVPTDATDPSTVGKWDIEASSINLMLSEGWAHDSYKPGDPITVIGHPTKYVSKNVLLFYVVKSDGTRLFRAQHLYPNESQ